MQKSFDLHTVDARWATKHTHTHDRQRTGCAGAPTHSSLGCTVHIGLLPAGTDESYTQQFVIVHRLKA